MAQPWPPGTEPEIPGADLGTVKSHGGELARHWPEGLPGEDYGVPEPGMPPPAASYTYDPPAPGRGDYVTFDGSASAPGYPDAPLTRYDWQFADKASMPDAAPVVTWRMPGAYGSYTVTLTVTASDGQAGQDAQVITI